MKQAISIVAIASLLAAAQGAIAGERLMLDGSKAACSGSLEESEYATYETRPLSMAMPELMLRQNAGCKNGKWHIAGTVTTPERVFTLTNIACPKMKTDDEFIWTLTFIKNRGTGEKTSGCTKFSRKGFHVVEVMDTAGNKKSYEYTGDDAQMMKFSPMRYSPKN